MRRVEMGGPSPIDLSKMLLDRDRAGFYTDAMNALENPSSRPIQPYPHRNGFLGVSYQPALHPPDRLSDSEFDNQLNSMPGVGRPVTFRASCAHGVTQTTYRRLHHDLVLRKEKFLPWPDNGQADQPRFPGSQLVIFTTAQEETRKASYSPQCAVDARRLPVPESNSKKPRTHLRDDEATETLEILEHVSGNMIAEGIAGIATPEANVMHDVMKWWHWRGQGQPGKGVDSKNEREKLVQQLERRVYHDPGKKIIPERQSNIDIKAKLTSLPDVFTDIVESIEVCDNFSVSDPSDILKNPLEKLPKKLPSQLRLLKIINASVTQFPKLTITGYPNPTVKIEKLLLDDNYIENIDPSLIFARKLRMLRIKNNNISRIPPWLLDLPSDAEINLQGNPISKNEVARFKKLEAEARMMSNIIDQATGRRMRPKPPQIILDDVGTGLQGLDNTNAHNVRLTNAFAATLNQLERLHPELAQAQPDYDDLERSVIDAIRRQAALAPDDFQMEFGDASLLDLAYKGVRVACDLGRRRMRTTEFPQTDPGRVLNLVSRHIATLASPVREQAIMRLAQHMSYARGNNDEGNGPTNDAVGIARCGDRLIEEMMQALRAVEAGLPPVEETKLEQVFSDDQVRDGLQKIAMKVYGEMRKRGVDLDTDDVPIDFERRFLHVAAGESVATDQQGQRYLDEFIRPLWTNFADYMPAPEAAGPAG